MLANLSLILANRAQGGRVLRDLLRPNRALVVLAAGAAAALALVLYVPSLAAVFQFEVIDLSRVVLAAAIGLASAMLPTMLTGMLRQKRPD